MILEGADLVKLSKLAYQHVDHVTCLECCKYYIAPETATCGHTLCHSCWKGQRSCPICKLPLERRALKLNLPAQTLTEHVHQLVEAFEKLFNIKLDQVISYAPNNEESENDPTKHVKDWLASSQNNFSAPLNSEKFSQETEAVLCNEISSSKIQVHTNTKKKLSSEKVLHMQVPQDDWDKIETLPDTENFTKNKENIVGPMDIEPYIFDDNEYTSDNPRRSSRKREFESNDRLSKAHDSSIDKPSSKDSSEEIDKKSNKMKQNWGNVKKMRKEFSKLNKINKNKLNVSIEMCKKTQSTKLNLPTLLHVSQHPLEIDENTPGVDINEPADNIEDNPIPRDNNNTNIMKRDDNNITDNCIRLVNESGKQNSSNTDNYEKKIEEKNITKLHEMNHIENSRKTNKKADECDIVKVPDIVRMPFFKKGPLYHESNGENSNNNDHDIDPIQEEEDNKRREDTENIEITIKVGNTIANIFIKKKDKDVQLNLKADQEIQTTLEPHEHSVNNIKTSKDVDVQTVNICFDENTNQVEVQSSTCNINNDKALHKKQIISNLNKSLSTKKNTASAETVTAHFEITESIEKELSNVMECVKPLSSEQIIKQSTNDSKSLSSKAKQNPTKNLDTLQNMEYLNDVDIFYSGSVKENNVQLLKNSNHAPSEILDSTVMTYKTMLKHPDKRERDTNDDDEVPSNKKQKIIFTKKRENKLETSVMENKVIKNDSGNYDTIMGQVFASIDADIDHNKQNMKKCKQNPLSVLHNNDNTSSKQINISKDNEIECTSILKECFNDKFSENVFTIYEKVKEVTTLDKEGPENTQHKQDLLTPVSVREMESQRFIHNQDITVDRVESTPYQEQDDDSDKSIVEETPQKNLSFSKHKQKSNIANQSQRLNLDVTKPNKQLSDAQNTKSIIILSNTEVSVEASKSNRDETVIETAHNQMLETPLTINKFVDQIKYKSTPVAKKSLNFKQNDDEKDPEQTLCPSADVVASTTQEKEFLTKAFENTPSPATKQLARSIKGSKKLCIAGSCLTSPEIAKLKLLCLDRKWAYSDKYTKEVTHLVVGVDEENKSQRSVKYMCSLAAGKWIVSFEWIENILKTKNVVDEACYEALDSTGEPGPRRSRLASNRNQKLFDGITFYCMPPFSVLDVDTLQSMLEAAGGRVVNAASGVLVTDGSRTPALLLAEPENTQEDRFIYLAMELKIVPVNYEWVLNCLGSYTLVSIQEMLLCPASLLPAATAKWPHELLARED